MAVKKSFQKITHGFPPNAVFREDWPEGSVPDVPAPTPGIAGGFIETYHACCALAAFKPSADLILHVQDLIDEGSA